MGVPKLPADPLVSDVIKAYRRDHVPHIAGPRTAREALGKIETKLGAYRPKELTDALMRDYAAWCEAQPRWRRQGAGNVSNGTVAREVNALRGVLGWAARNHQIAQPVTASRDEQRARAVPVAHRGRRSHCSAGDPTSSHRGPWQSEGTQGGRLQRITASYAASTLTAWNAPVVSFTSVMRITKSSLARHVLILRGTASGSAGLISTTRNRPPQFCLAQSRFSRRSRFPGCRTNQPSKSGGSLPS